MIVLQISGHSDGATRWITPSTQQRLPNRDGNARADAPINAVLPAWDLVTGMTAALGLLGASASDGTGQGQAVKLALSDVACATAGNLGYIGEWQLNHEQREASGNDLYGAFGRDFPTSDAKRVMVAAISLRQWRGLVSATTAKAQMDTLAQMLVLISTRGIVTKRATRLLHSLSDGHGNIRLKKYAKHSMPMGCAGVPIRPWAKWSTTTGV